MQFCPEKREIGPEHIQFVHRKLTANFEKKEYNIYEREFKEVTDMAGIKELIRSEADGSVSFGDYTLKEKTKLEDFPHEGDKLKVKTFNEITRLEKNGLFIYESVPGTTVTEFKETEDGISFKVEGNEDVQITVGLQEDTEYKVFVAGEQHGIIKTNLGGKLSFGAQLADAGVVEVKVIK